MGAVASAFWVSSGGWGLAQFILAEGDVRWQDRNGAIPATAASDEWMAPRQVLSTRLRPGTQDEHDASAGLGSGLPSSPACSPSPRPW